MDVRASGVLTADDAIVVQPPDGDMRWHALHLGMYSPGGVVVYADRAQLVRLRNELTAALNGEA